MQRRERDPRTHTFATLADLYFEMGELDQALEVVEDGLRHHPHFLNARLVQAKLLRELGRDRDAAAAFRQVLEIDSENRAARAALAELVDGVETVARTEGSRAADRRPRAAAQWLARLDDEWRNGAVSGQVGAVGDRDVPGSDQSAVGSAEAEASSEGPGPVASPVDVEDETPGDGAGVGDETAGRGGKMKIRGSSDGDLETATLAQLYVSQGLVDQAIGIYERLLARDPYNARLAASLEEVRQRARTENVAPRETRPARPPRPRLDPDRDGNGASAGEGGRAEAAVQSPPDHDPTTDTTIREFLRALIEGEAPAGAARDADVDWQAWLRDLGECQ